MTAEEMVCHNHVHDSAGIYAVFYSLAKDPQDVKTLFFPVRDNKEFPTGTHVIAHFSYNATWITDMEGNVLRLINL